MKSEMCFTVYSFNNMASLFSPLRPVAFLIGTLCSYLAALFNLELLSQTIRWGSKHVQHSMACKSHLSQSGGGRWSGGRQRQAVRSAEPLLWAVSKTIQWWWHRPWHARRDRTPGVEMWVQLWQSVGVRQTDSEGHFAQGQGKQWQVSALQMPLSVWTLQVHLFSDISHFNLLQSYAWNLPWTNVRLPLHYAFWVDEFLTWLVCAVTVDFW